jgi:hypothetical protein
MIVQLLYYIIDAILQSLIRGHNLHPLIVWGDISSELSQPNFWVSYHVSRIASESQMLDIRNSAFGIRARHTALSNAEYTDDVLALDSDISFTVDRLAASQEDSSSFAPTPHPPPIDLELPPSRPRISLQDMISTSLALKSNLDIEILRPSHSWPSGLFPTAASSPSRASISLPPETESPSSLQAENSSHGQSQPIPFHVAQAISGLQREVLLLRNDLNFEVWLSRENVRHIGRLYQERILSKNAEAERQGLVRLRNLSKSGVNPLTRQPVQ